ncbi:MAG: signal peptidase I [Promethearchaeota archaeon]|nr:MAG: signal peptidase I [Candidatus Lokiarchaeota archaeon]
MDRCPVSINNYPLNHKLKFDFFQNSSCFIPAKNKNNCSYERVTETQIVKSTKFWQDLPEKQKKETVNTVLLIAIIIGGTVGVMGLTKVILRTNYPLVVVTSESMLPGIEIGDLLVVKGMDPEDIVVGDHDAQNGSIIIYETEGIWGNDAIDQPVVHRVVGREYIAAEDRYYFITQGDNNFDTDPPGSVTSEIPVPEENVLGVVIYQIPKVGLVKIWLDKSGLTWVLIAILSVLLVISIIQDIRNPEDKSEEEKSKSKNSMKNAKNEIQDGDTFNSSDSSGIDPPKSKEYDLGS